MKKILLTFIILTSALAHSTELYVVKNNRLVKTDRGLYHLVLDAINSEGEGLCYKDEADDLVDELHYALEDSDYEVEGKRGVVGISDEIEFEVLDDSSADILIHAYLDDYSREMTISPCE